MAAPAWRRAYASGRARARVRDGDAGRVDPRLRFQPETRASADIRAAGLRTCSRYRAAGALLLGGEGQHRAAVSRGRDRDRGGVTTAPPSAPVPRGADGYRRLPTTTATAIPATRAAARTANVAFW